MDIQSFMEWVAGQDFISYSSDNGSFSNFNTIMIVYATIMDDTIIIAGKDSEIEIKISEIGEIAKIEDNLIRIYFDHGELDIVSKKS